MELDPIATSARSPSDPKRITLRRIFIGQNGLRAGWRLAIYVVIANLLGMLVEGILRRLPGMAGFLARIDQTGITVTPESLLFRQGLRVAVFLTTAAIMARAEKRPFGVYGLPLRLSFGKLFWQGVVWGLIYQTIEVFVIWMFGGFTFGTIALSGSTLLSYAIVWAVGFVLVGLDEEFQFRGYTQFTLADGIGFWPAALITSSLFGAYHLGNANENWIGIVNVVVFAIFACFTLRRTGNLWWVVGFHATTDYGESFIYSTPNSGQLVQGHLLNSSFHGPRWLTGGSVGPEGSMIDFVLLGLTALAFAQWHRSKKETIG